MSWIIIGSTAAYHWFPDWRQPKDIDILTTDKSGGMWGTDSQAHELGLEIINASRDKVFADRHLLYTLKVSHAYWDIHWKKTIFDIDQFQQRGVYLDQGLHDRLVKMWTTIHGSKKVNLNQTADTFWQDGVKRQYDHEWLHEIVAFDDEPLHLLLHEDDTVRISQARFNELPRSLQLQVAQEEILTTAIERGNLSVKSSKADILSAVNRAHFLLCTSMTKGWFAQFCVQHTRELVKDRSTWYDHLTTVLQKLPKEQS